MVTQGSHKAIPCMVEEQIQALVFYNCFGGCGTKDRNQSESPSLIGRLAFVKSRPGKRGTGMIENYHYIAKIISIPSLF